MLGGIDIWLREQGHYSQLNLSPRRGNITYAATPNISLPLKRTFLRIQDDRLRVCKLTYLRSFNHFDEIVLELTDPALFDQLTTILGDPHADTSRPD